jgi:hypothetical protein
MLRQQLAEEWRRCFYTAIEPDLDFESDSYDPTRECFNIVDGAVASSDDTEDDGNAGAAVAAPAAGGDPKTPGQEGPQNPPPPQDEKAEQLAQLRELKAKLDEDREQLNQLERALEQDQDIRKAQGLEVTLETSTDRSSRTENQNTSSTASLEQDRT